MITEWCIVGAIGLYSIVFLIVSVKIFKLIHILRKHYRNPRSAWRKDDYWNPAYRDENL